MNDIPKTAHIVEIPNKIEIATSTAPSTATAVSPFVRVGYWGWGIVLVLLLGFIACVLLDAASCVDPAKTTKDMLALGGCSAWTQRWYLVLRDWQSGLGAAIGLLGIAWSTFFNSASSKS
ncbi:hypothetical protein [Terrarubrum flagellatum]|uniref:hypothetical protein n=1 Tax=Terrirubrum flagellatum TaxID=2895980 RepID=UPI00314517A7